MRHVILSIVMWLLANVAHAFEIEDRACSGMKATAHLLDRIDRRYQLFQTHYRCLPRVSPDVTIDYTVASSTEVMNAISREKHPLTSSFPARWICKQTGQ